VASFNGLPLKEIAVIGDGANDMGMLSIEGIGLAGTVRNGQPAVKALVASQSNGFIASAEAVTGVNEFLSECVLLRIKRVIADRDGVLRYRCDQAEHAALAALISRFDSSGIGLDILTGSSIEQNMAFIRDSGIVDLVSSSKVDLRIHAENGAIELDPRTKISSLAKGLDYEPSSTLIASLTTAVLAEITDTVLHRFNLAWGRGEATPTTLVSVPKRAMVTIDTPKAMEGDEHRLELQSAVVSCFERVLNRAAVSYVKVDGEGVAQPKP